MSTDCITHTHRCDQNLQFLLTVADNLSHFVSQHQWKNLDQHFHWTVQKKYDLSLPIECEKPRVYYAVFCSRKGYKKLQNRGKQQDSGKRK